MRKWIFRSLAMFWMGLIFWFSSRDAVTSTTDSYFAGRIVAETVIPGFREAPQEKQERIVQAIDHPVRKTAHFAEYLVLGVLLAGALQPDHEEKAGEHSAEDRERRTCSGKRGADKKTFSWFCSWIAGTVYAATDEIHQVFVAGRSGQLSDVMLDSAGVFTGVLVMWCVFQALKPGKRK